MRRRPSARHDLPQRRRPLKRVKALTLGNLAKGGVQRIQCECEWCRHEGAIEVASLIAKMGEAATYRDVAERLVCSVCGWHGIVAQPVWPGDKDKLSSDGMISDRPVKKSPPLPSMDMCRAVLAAVPVDPAAQLIDQRAAYVDALMERWPELTASAALLAVQKIIPWRGAPKIRRRSRVSF